MRDIRKWYAKALVDKVSMEDGSRERRASRGGGTLRSKVLFSDLGIDSTCLPFPPHPHVGKHFLK